VMAANGHHRRLDAVARKLPTVRPSPEVLEGELDRLIALYQAREAGGPSVGPITPKWPWPDLDRWMAEIISELAAEERPRVRAPDGIGGDIGYVRITEVQFQLWSCATITSTSRFAHRE